MLEFCDIEDADFFVDYYLEWNDQCYVHCYCAGF
jgi:hypothetical protein